MHSNTIQETARLSIPAHFFFYQNDSKEQVPFPLESYSNLSHLFSNLPTKIQHSQNISENIGMYLLAQKANFISKCDRSTIRDSNPVSLSHKQSENIHFLHNPTVYPSKQNEVVVYTYSGIFQWASNPLNCKKKMALNERTIQLLRKNVIKAKLKKKKKRKSPFGNVLILSLLAVNFQ